MPLVIRVSKDEMGGTVRVHPAGSLDSTTAPALERELAPILAGADRVLVLDFERGHLRRPARASASCSPRASRWRREAAPS